jgi:hypothetical protein
VNKVNTDSFFAGLLAIILLIIIAPGCKKDKDDNGNGQPPSVHPLVGTYAFIESRFNDPITVIVNGDTNHYLAGDDAYLFVGGGLLGAAPCDDAGNAALELRQNFTSYYVCVGESNEAQQGTWEYVENIALLKLNISNPANFLVNITTIELLENALNGNIPSLPMPYDTSIPVGDPLPGGGINFQTANVSVKFEKLY